MGHARQKVLPAQLACLAYAWSLDSRSTLCQAPLERVVRLSCSIPQGAYPFFFLFHSSFPFFLSPGAAAGAHSAPLLTTMVSRSESSRGSTMRSRKAWSLDTCSCSSSPSAARSASYVLSSLPRLQQETQRERQAARFAATPASKAKQRSQRRGRMVEQLARAGLCFAHALPFEVHLDARPRACLFRSSFTALQRAGHVCCRCPGRAPALPTQL